MSSGLQKLRARRIPKWLVPALGYLVSLGCLVWAFKDVDLREILDSLKSLHWGWVTVAVISDIGVYVFQAWRWNLLLRPVVRAPLMRSVQAIYVGLFANEVLPLRPGELIRSYLQAHWSKLPFSVAFSSAMIERVFDGIWLMVAFMVTTAFVTLPKDVLVIARLLGIIVVWAALILALVLFRKHHAHAAVSKTRWGARLQVLVEDLHLMGSSPSFYLAAFVSVFYLLIQVIPIYALMQGYGRLDLSIWPAMVLLVILRLGTAIPQAPGNLGAFQAVTILALGMFEVDKTTAAGYAVMVWAVITLPLLVAGFIALAITGTKLRELHRHAKAMASAPAAGSESR